MERGLAAEEVEQRGIVGLDDEEEDLFKRYLEQLGANNDILGICPNLGAYQVRVPWYSPDHCDLKMVSYGGGMSEMMGRTVTRKKIR